jgi:hypothetical protein
VLVKIGVLRRFRPRREVGSAPWHYLLGPVGAALLGAEDRDERRWLPQVRADRQLALAGSQRLAHMIGVNWFFVSLAAHARTGGGELRAWLNAATPADRARQRDRRDDRAADDGDDDLSAYVKEVVDTLPPLTEEQRDLLALIFRSSRAA